MKKLITILIFLTGIIYAQPITKIDSTIFVAKTGGGDSTYWIDLGMKYAFVYVIVTDTGATYTDSIKVYSITKPRTSGADSSFSQLDLWGKSGTTSNTWFTATSNANATTKYWVYDAAIDKLYIVMSNAQYIAGRRVKITILCVTH